MDDHERPWRSALYIPGSKERALDKARRLPADALIFDLEDAVAVDEKVAARATLAAALAEDGYGARARIVRINGLDTAWGADDLAALAEARPQAVLLPKAGSADDIARLERHLDGHAGFANTRIWAMMESCAGVLAAREIAAASPRMAGFVLGTNDLARELGARMVPGREPLLASLSICLLAARTAGLICLDGVYNAFRDADGLRAEAVQGRDMGFDGKTLINPSQIAAANAVFAPTEAEIDLARRQIAAFDEARARGDGVAVVDGRIVENLHVATAQRVLAQARAIAALAWE